MAKYRVRSKNQLGGVTAGRVNLGVGEPPPPPSRHVWRTVVAIGIIIGIAAGLAEVLGYFNIRPGEPTKVSAPPVTIAPAIKLNEPKADTAKKPVVKKETPVTDQKKPTGNTFNVTSHNQTGGITAGQINLAPPQVHLDKDGEAWLLANVKRDGPAVEITSTQGAPDTYILAREIEAFLRAQGYNVRGIGIAGFQPPRFGVSIDPNSEWTNVVVGYLR